MATEAATKSSTVDEKSENVQSEGRNKKTIHEYSVPITGTQKTSFILIFMRRRRIAKKCSKKK